MSDDGKPSDKDQVRALLDRLPDDCTFADIQRAHRRADVAQARRRQPGAARSAWSRKK